MEPLEEAVLKEFCERLARSELFSGVNLHRLYDTLSGDTKPKAEEVIAVLRETKNAAPGSKDDPH